jgi:2-aminoadipate transaminase
MVQPSTVLAPRVPAAERVGSSAIRDLLRLTERPEVISFAGGLPDPATFPATEISEAATHVLADHPELALQYSTTEGFSPLRAWIAEQRSAAAGAEGVITTHGSQQALDLLLRATIEPGDPVVVADPCYVGALQALRLAQADIVAVGSDGDGLDTDDLADRLDAGLRPRLVYVVANFHNPTGVTLAEHRRRALADLADRYGFVVIDDDPYGELRFAGAPVTPLASMTDRVVTLGSFSKILSPGLRLGYAVAPRAIAAELTIVKQAADLHTSSLTQRIVHEVITRDGFLDRHLDSIRSTYRTRAATLSAALRRHLGDRLAFDAPEGGMFLWARWLDPSIDSEALLVLAIDAGVAYVPGAAFAAVPGRPSGASMARGASTTAAPMRSTFRLSFATPPVADLDEGARRLASIVMPER